MKAIKPEIKEKRFKAMIFGPAGVGKTMCSIQFDHAYIVDGERGTDFYSKSIAKANSVVLQSNDPDEILGEIRELLTTKHPYKTLIIDPITAVWQSIQDKWSRVFEKYATTDKERDVQDWGMRYWGKVKSQYKQLQRMLTKLDMNLIIISHMKDVYGTGFSKIGTTWDSARGDDYFFDLIFQIEKKGDQRICKTIKERAEIGESKFPPEFEWSYENFLKFYGKEIIEKESIPILMATKDQVEKLEKLVKGINLDEDVVNKWLQKASVDSFSEFTGEQIAKCIEFVEKQLHELNGAKLEPVENPTANGKKTAKAVRS